MSNAYKAVKLEADQAVVSLVDKEVIKTKLAAVYETIRAYHKSQEALKMAQALEHVERWTQAALAQV